VPDYLAKPFGLEGSAAAAPALARNPAAARSPTRRPGAAAPGRLSLELERRHIEQVLRNASSLDEAATSLGINASTLWRKRKRYGIG
jgi:NtrC-family two-component system response regulator AlgB